MQRSSAALAGIGAAALLLASGGALLQRSEKATAWESAQAGHPLELADWLAERGERLAPGQVLPQTHTLDANTLAFLRADCDALPTLTGSAEREKLATHTQAACEGHRLPQAFYEAPPWIHPLGGSYAMRDGKPGPLHADELPASHPIAQLAPTTRTALAQGQRAVLGPSWWVQLEDQQWTRTPRSSLENSLAWQGYLIPPGCEGASCLTPTPRAWVWPTLWFGAGTLTIAAIMLVLHQQREARAHAEQQRLVIRTLTHELRTPATSIALAVDRMRKHFDALPADGQDAFLALASSNQRLRATLEATNSLLALQAGSHLSLAPCDVHEILESAGAACPQEATLTTDSRLLSLVVHNVVSNAYEHGAEPVVAELHPSSDSLRITIMDAGAFTSSPASLAQAFQRGPHSEGLGLGLTIASQALAVLGGTLTIETEPTRVHLTLPASP